MLLMPKQQADMMLNKVSDHLRSGKNKNKRSIDKTGNGLKGIQARIRRFKGTQ